MSEEIFDLVPSRPGRRTLSTLLPLYIDRFKQIGNVSKQFGYVKTKESAKRAVLLNLRSYSNIFRNTSEMHYAYSLPSVV